MTLLACNKNIRPFVGAHAKTLHGAVKALIVYASERRKILQDHILVTYADNDVVAARSGLLVASCPPAIVGLVVAVHVHAINRKAGGTRPHVFQKIRKVFAPTATHGYSASAIIGEFGIIRIVASLLSVLPRSQFSGCDTPAPVSMRGRSQRRHILAQASATFCRATSDVFNPHVHNTPAVALKAPDGSPTAIGLAAKGNKATIAFASDFYWCNHVRSVA